MTTVSNSEVGSSDFVDAPTERESAFEVPIGVKSEATLSDIWPRALAYFTPPSIFTEQPASMADLRRYAHAAAWTSKAGARRALGIGYFRLIARPTTIACRYVEWIGQRPGRAIPVYALWKLVIETPPGPWIAQHFIMPLASFAGWLFL